MRCLTYKLNSTYTGCPTNRTQSGILGRSGYSGEAGACLSLKALRLSHTTNRQSIIIRAEGEAQSAELIGEAVRQNKGFLQLRRLEAARDIANLLATSGNNIMLDSQSLLLNGEPVYLQLVCIY